MSKKATCFLSVVLSTLALFMGCASAPEPLQEPEEVVFEQVERKSGGKNSSKAGIDSKGSPIYSTYLNPDREFQDGSPILTSATCFEGRDTILCNFAGDLMAHEWNWRLGDFDSIYTDILPELAVADLNFVNFETPVDESKEYQTYPTFNVKNEYADAAIRAGFNVFSLVNNHTNDQGLSGMKATRDYFKQKHLDTLDFDRTVYSAGIRESSNGPYTYQVVETNGWKILFMAITEVVNRMDYTSWMDFVSPTGAKRRSFISEIKRIKAENPCDLFVLSVHCCDPEYIFSVTETQKKFYYDLLASGVDVVWANHPHVSKNWELVHTKADNSTKLIFYAQGNSISGQRHDVNFPHPEVTREYTGEGFMTQVRFERIDGKVQVVQINPILLTTFKNDSDFMMIKKLNDGFIQSLYDQGNTVWGDYLSVRKRLMDEFHGNIVWQ